MKKTNTQFEKNIARLVKLAGDPKTPSERFTETLIDSALGELGQAQTRRQRSFRMKSITNTLIKIAAVVFVVIGIAAVFTRFAPQEYSQRSPLAYEDTGANGPTIQSPAEKTQPIALVTPRQPSPAARPAEAAMRPAPAQEDWVPIPLTLPKPMFIGTPENFSNGLTLEKPLGRARPPFLAPKGTSNVALNRPVTSSESFPFMGELSMIVDGDKEGVDSNVVELGPFRQWIVIDLEQEHHLYAVVIWHYHSTPRVYFDVAVQVSNDPAFVNATTIFNNDHDNSLGLGVGSDLHYVETAEGKLIDAKGIRGRYIRLWSHGNTQNDYNHYIEVEVFGKPVGNETASSQNGVTPSQKAESLKETLMPIELNLPRPMFVGTPTSLSMAQRSPSPAERPASPNPSYPQNWSDISARRGMALEPANSQRMAHGGTTPPNAEPVDAMFFKNYGVNPFIDTEDDHLSTFAIDVDTGSYTLSRSYLQQGNLPPRDAVRVEEFVNYFDYRYPAPQQDTFAVFFEAMPWSFGQERQNTYLMRIGLKALEVPDELRKPAVLTFVIDVSGSMSREDRLGLVKQSLRLLIDKLRPDDKIGIAVYGSRGQAVLQHTTLSRRDAILEAIDALRPEGSTYAEEGIRIGYEMAQAAFTPGHINRVILCSDGVSNVGQTGADQILQIIKEKADNGITLSALGFGMGNYNDVLMEQLGNKGNGYYAYIDTFDQAQRLFGNLTGALQVVARDVKIQVDFNPDVVRSYRLIGYENRDVADEDFRNDTVDGGEIGAGHATTALYELKLWPEKEGHVATTYIRYKDPDTFEVTEVSADFNAAQIAQSDAISNAFALSSVVTEFAEILRESYWAKGADLADTLARVEMMYENNPDDPDIAELKDLITRATQLLKNKQQQTTPSNTPDPDLIPADIEYRR